MVEQRPFKSLVLGSNPSGTTNFGVGLRRFDSVVILADVQQPIWTRQDNCHQGSIPCAPSILLTSFNPSTRLIAQWKSQPKSPSLSDLLPKATKTVACWPKSAARWTTMRAITNTLTLQHLTVTNVSPNWPCALQSPLTLDAFNVDFHREFLSLINEAMPPLRDHKRNWAVPILFWSADGAQKYLLRMHERIISIKSAAEKRKSSPSSGRMPNLQQSHRNLDTRSLPLHERVSGLHL